jgi:small subunit ribosomal protein S16
MAVHIRLSRAGAKKRPFYRVIVADHRSPRGGRFLENIGTYDPTREAAPFEIDEARLAYWRGHGAQPSQTVHQLLLRQARAVAAGAAGAPADGSPAVAASAAK